MSGFCIMLAFGVEATRSPGARTPRHPTGSRFESGNASIPKSVAALFAFASGVAGRNAEVPLEEAGLMGVMERIQMKKLRWKQLLMCARLVIQSACATAQVTEWEHGWKTDRVIATRYNNDVIGYSVGFKYPKNPNDCDRAELTDFMRLHEGAIYQGGGYPGAEMFVSFKGVKDRPTADKKIKEIIPALSKLIEDLGNGVKVKIPRPANEKVWPDTDAPDKSNPYWEFNNNINSNGVQYHKVEVSPDKWQWIVDEPAMKSLRDEEAHKTALWRALTTRVLTEAELKEVGSYGSYLNVPSNTSYDPSQKLQELHNALLIQQMLRGQPKEIHP